jgi:hypothetical protein
VRLVRRTIRVVIGQMKRREVNCVFLRNAHITRFLNGMVDVGHVLKEWRQIQKKTVNYAGLICMAVNLTSNSIQNQQEMI